MMFANVLLILCAYYFIKPLREGWLAVSDLGGLSKMEIKAYSSFAQCLLLIFVVAGYSKLVGRWSRSVLITRTTLFCMVVQLGFWFMQPNFFLENLPFSGIVFFLWVGMFGVFVVAQFWAFAADLYTDERGRRLLPMIAIGATSGATVGSGLASWLVSSGILGTEYLLLASLVPLGLSIWLTRAADSAETAANPPKPPSEEAAAAPADQTDGKGGLALVLGSSFLLAVAVITMLLNWVNTNGENLLFQVVNEALERDVAAQGIAAGEAALLFVKDGTTAFYAGFFFWVNLVALFLQAVVASRLLKYGGFASIFMLLPVIALASYTAMALVPVLWVVKWMKVAENSTDYSINNTARHVLWLPMSSEVTYRGKPTIDTLFARAGDGLAALTVLVGVHALGLSLQMFFVVNVSLVVIWLVSSVFVVRQHRRLTEEAEA
jgi:AAA family ATP:ADP antiporter